MRRVGVLAAGLAAAAIWLPACSPVDATWITLTHDGVPKVDNCGTYVTGVEAADAATDRTVWAARIPDRVVEDQGGDIPVVLGRVPNEYWVEDTPLALDPRPAEWVFTISNLATGREIIRVADDDLAAGFAYRPGHHRETTKHLLDHTCNAPYLGPQPLLVLALVPLGLGVFGWLMGRRMLRRAEARAAP